MNRISLARLAPLLAALLALALLAPAARADDQSFARTAIAQAAELSRLERAAAKALARVDAKGRAAVPAARRAVKAVRRQATLMTRAAEAEQTSTPDGEATKRRLIELLAIEQRAYATLDRALAAYKRGNMRTANTLIARAKRQIRGVTAEAVKLGERLRVLAG